MVVFYFNDFFHYLACQCGDGEFSYFPEIRSLLISYQRMQRKWSISWPNAVSRILWVEVLLYD